MGGVPGLAGVPHMWGPDGVSQLERVKRRIPHSFLIFGYTKVGVGLWSGQMGSFPGDGNTLKWIM